MYWVVMVSPLLVPFWTSPDSVAEVAPHIGRPPYPCPPTTSDPMAYAVWTRLRQAPGGASGGREGGRQPIAHGCDVHGRERRCVAGGRRRGDELQEALGPQHVNSARREGTADERPVGSDEAQHARHGDGRVVDGRADEVDLPQHPVDELRAVTSTDDELLCALAEEPALDAEGGPALVLLRVDDEDAVARDDDVVDVGPRPRNAPVVQHGEVVTHEGVETAAHELLALRAGVPGPGALRLLGDGEEESADARVALANAALPGVAPSFELAPRRPAGRAAGFPGRLGLEGRLGLSFLGDDGHADVVALRG